MCELASYLNLSKSPFPHQENGKNNSQRVVGIREAKTVLSVYLDFLSGSDGKESACNVGDPDTISGLGRAFGEGNIYLHYFG